MSDPGHSDIFHDCGDIISFGKNKPIWHSFHIEGLRTARVVSAGLDIVFPRTIAPNFIVRSVGRDVVDFNGQCCVVQGLRPNGPVVK